MKRRELLALLSGATATVAGCSSDDWFGGSDPEEPVGESPGGQSSGTSSQGTAQGGTSTPDASTATDSTRTAMSSRFDRVVDAVEDLGCDPNGEEPCDSAIERAATDGTLLEFPSGTYRFQEGHRFYDVDILGFDGKGDVSFVPPEGFNDKLIGIVGGWALFRGIDVDVSAADTTAGIRFITRSGFRVEDVEFVGRGDHPDGAVVNALALAVMDPAERGLVRNVVARRGSAIGHYKGGNGRVGMWVGQRHNGRISIEDCRLEEFGNNGIYASRCLGSVEVVGGVFRNNNASSVRVGGGENVVRGATIEIDVDSYGGPTTLTKSNYNTRAIVVEQGEYDKSGRALIEDCDVRVRSVDHSQGGIVVWSTGHGARIVGCRISVESDSVPAIRAQPASERIDVGSRALLVRDTTITGSAADGPAVDIRERPQSTIEHTTIEQPGADRDGIRLTGSNPCTLASSSVTATRYPVIALNPRTDSDQCLVVVDDETRLERSSPDPESVQTDEFEVPTRQYGAPAYEPLRGTELTCLGRALLSELDSSNAVGITEIRDGSVSWVASSSIRTDDED